MSHDKDKSDDELAEEYLGIDGQVKTLDVQKKGLKAELFNRLDDHGNPHGKDQKHLKIDTENYRIIKQARSTKTVHQDVALELFDEKGIDDFEVDSIITVKSGVDVTKIPSKLIKEINKFFSIENRRTVSKQSLEHQFNKGKIDHKEYKACISEAISHSLKIDKV